MASHYFTANEKIDTNPAILCLFLRSTPLKRIMVYHE